MVQARGAPQAGLLPQTGYEGDGGEARVPVRPVALPRWLPETRRRIPASTGRRRHAFRAGKRRGRYIRARMPRGTVLPDIAWDATFRAAAPHQPRRGRGPGQGWQLRPEDLREKVRAEPAGALILFVVDASWSMAVGKRMEATKGAILQLLEEAYRRRERVGMIVFRREGAQVILPPTRSVQMARRMLAEVPVGGKTPLAAGLALAYEVIRRERLRDPELHPVLVVLTDGAGNVSLYGGSPLEEAYTWAKRLRRLGVRGLVINMEQPQFDRGLARQLAEHLQAACLTPLEWTPTYLAAQVRRRMSEAQG